MKKIIVKQTGKGYKSQSVDYQILSWTFYHFFYLYGMCLCVNVKLFKWPFSNSLAPLTAVHSYHHST